MGQYARVFLIKAKQMALTLDARDSVFGAPCIFLANDNRRKTRTVITVYDKPWFNRRKPSTIIGKINIIWEKENCSVVVEEMTNMNYIESIFKGFYDLIMFKKEKRFLETLRKISEGAAIKGEGRKRPHYHFPGPKT